MGKQRFLLGDWLVSPDEGMLSHEEKTVRLEPKAMDVLVYLASRQGEVVSREDLEKDVWHGALVGYDAVTKTVIKLRKALGDSARNPKFIATVPKRGYQLIASASALPGADISDSVESDGEATRLQPSSARYGRNYLAGVLVTIMLILAWTGFTMLSGDSQLVSADDPHLRALDTPTIVVLPFRDLSDNQQHGSFSDGVTDDIITDLSSLSGLSVIARNTAFTYKDREIAATELAEDLNVDYVVEGSIRRYGDRVRVNAHLVDARTGFQKWAKRFDRETTQVFAVQDEVTGLIVKALAINLTRQEEQRLARRTTNNLAAYDHFQEGQRLAQSSTREANIEAQAAYRRAIETDPVYGRAYGALAYTLAFQFRRGWSNAPMQTIDRALELARRGVELDNSIPQTYWSLGYVYLMRKEYGKALLAVREALEVSPNYADGYGLQALILNGLGNAKEAIEMVRRGMQLNPFYTWDYPYNLGRAQYALGRIDEAIEALEEARSRNENATPIRLHLAAAYVRAGRQDDAEWEAEELQMLNPQDTLSHLKNTIPLQDAELMDKLLNDLRAAGLPE